jgi:hypothetical protein
MPVDHPLDQTNQLVPRLGAELRIESFLLGEPLGFVNPGQQQRDDVLAPPACAHRARAVGRPDAVVTKRYLNTVWRRLRANAFGLEALALMAGVPDAVLRGIAPSPFDEAFLRPILDVSLGNMRGPSHCDGEMFQKKRNAILNIDDAETLSFASFE